jgi:putative PIN family toxin of toxin-antitoxin system
MLKESARLSRSGPHQAKNSTSSPRTLTASSMTTVPENRLRVVFDTNVYFSAFTLQLGPPFRIWQMAVKRNFVLLVSPAILGEVAHVLRDVLKWQEAEIVAQLKLVAKVAEIVSPTVRLRVIAEDFTDDRILECALAGGIDLIVSGDRHLRKLKSFRNVGIVSRAIFFALCMNDPLPLQPQFVILR